MAIPSETLFWLASLPVGVTEQLLLALVGSSFDLVAWLLGLHFDSGDTVLATAAPASAAIAERGRAAGGGPGGGAGLTNVSCFDPAPWHGALCSNVCCDPMSSSELGVVVEGALLAAVFGDPEFMD
jgi:hypothetical protein